MKLTLQSSTHGLIAIYGNSFGRHSFLLAIFLYLHLCCAPTLHAQNWNQIIKAVAADRAASDWLGYSVAISGDYAVVGAPRKTGTPPFPNAGAAYIFKRTGTNWVQEAQIVASNRASFVDFGASVAISGDYVLVGASGTTESAITGSGTLSNAGSAYIFKRTGTTWAQEAKIVAADRDAFDFFGKSVAINGDYAVVGADSEGDNPGGGAQGNPGAAYIFKRTGTTWAQEAKIVAADRAAYDYFGASVAISGDYVVVGAYGESENATGGNTLSTAGSAYIFKRTGTSWAQEAKIVASDRAADDRFGYSVAISGDYVVVGAYLEDENAAGGNTLSSAGSAYIFKRTGTTWAQGAKIVASDRAAYDFFGYSVTISGDYVVVGAYGESENATGGNTLSGAGSAYIFKRTGTNWAQEAKIVASDRAAGDNFGISVGISGQSVVVGTYRESEDAIGGSTLSGAGSAYFFKPIPVWTGAVSTDWSDPANWQPAFVPASVENVFIPSTSNLPSLSSNLTVGSVTLASGSKFALGNYNLTVDSIIGGSSSSYIVTNGTGSLTINNIGTSPKLFPVGPSATEYTPVTISNNVSRNFTVKVSNTVTSPVSNFRYVNNQWNITPSVLTGNSATLAFGWSASAQAATFNPALPVQINHFNTTTNTWDASFRATVSGTNPYTATANGITAFSPFSVSNSPIVPIELLYFAATPSVKGNLLTWQTATEINNKGFDIERLNGNTWETLGFVKGNNKASTYQFVDVTPLSISYYRLRQIDNDGTETLSKVVSIQSKGNGKLKVYPNPVFNTLTIETDVKGDYQIINLLGQVVLRGFATAQRIDVSALPKGSYILKMGNEQAQFIKQ